MVEVIETNISIDDYRNIKDYQSRMVQVPSWEEYITLYTKYCGIANGRDYKTHNNNLLGCVMPSNATIDNLEYDNFHLKCDIRFFNGSKEIKLAYLIV